MSLGNKWVCFAQQLAFTDFFSISSWKVVGNHTRQKPLPPPWMSQTQLHSHMGTSRVPAWGREWAGGAPAKNSLCWGVALSGLHRGDCQSLYEAQNSELPNRPAGQWTFAAHHMVAEDLATSMVLRHELTHTWTRSTLVSSWFYYKCITLIEF